MNEVVIFEIRPPRMEVVSGETDVLTVKVQSVEQVRSARLVLANTRPAVADLFDDDESGVDRVRSEPKDLTTGDGFFAHEIGFELPDAAERGAIIALKIHVEDGDGDPVSGKRTISVVIAAG